MDSKEDRTIRNSKQPAFTILPGAIGLLFSSGLVFAVEPAIVQLGNFNVIPTLGLDILHDDNIFRDNTDETSSFLGVMTPTVNLGLIDGLNSYNFQAQIIDGSFTDSSDDDFTDWQLSAIAHLEITSRNIVDITLSHFAAHEFRGTGVSQYSNRPDEPDQFDEQQAEIVYQYGARTANRLVFNLNLYDREYTNNREFNEGFSYDRLGYGATFFLNVLPRTDILFELRQSDVNYAGDTSATGNVFNPNNDDSTETYGYIGVSWEATAQTTGEIRIGQGRKDFQAGNLEDQDQSLPSYEAGITWSPRTYSEVEFSASQTFGASFGGGDAIENRTIELNWRHDWSNRLSSEFRASNSNYDYIGSNLVDEFQTISAGLSYGLARWIDVRMELLYDNRDSSESLFGYDRSVITLGFVASL